MGTVKKEKDDVKITLKYHPSAYPQHPLGLNKCQSQALTFTDSERETSGPECTGWCRSGA